MNPKISIIVPVYGVEKYIEKCATSLFEQTMEDIEYVFVDDCTPDNSMEVLQTVVARYPERQNGVVMVKMPRNSGQGAVRAQGMRKAKGEYVIHCDSDDWMDTNLVELMYESAKKNDSDMVIAPYCEERYDGQHFDDLPENIASGKDVLQEWYHDPMRMACWNKLVRRKVYVENDVYPVDGIDMWEDNCLMLRMMYYCDRISTIRGGYYHYNRMNQGAMTAEYGRKAVNQMIKCAHVLTDFFGSKPGHERYANTVYAVQYLAKLNLVTHSFAWLKEYRALFPESNRIVPKIVPEKTFSRKGHVRFLFVKYHLEVLFVLLFKVLRIIKR